MTIFESLNVLKKNLAVLAVFPIAFALIAAGYSWGFMANEYSASGTLNAYRGTATIAALINLPEFQNEVLDALSMNGDGKTYSLSAKNVSGTTLITVSGRGPVPQKVADIVNEAMRIAKEKSPSVLPRDSSLMIAEAIDAPGEDNVDFDPVTVSVVSPAVVPVEASGPNRMKYVLVAFAVGMLFGLCIIFAKELVKRRKWSSDDFSRILHMPVLGSSSKCIDSIFESIEIASIDSPKQCVAFVPALCEKGSSEIVSSCSLEASKRGLRCLLIEANNRNPVFAPDTLKPTADLASVLIKKDDYTKVICQVPSGNLEVAFANLSMTDATEVLASDAFSMLLNEKLKSAYDYVLVNSPSAQIPGSAAVAEACDCSLIIVGDNRRNQDELVDAIQPFFDKGIIILGAVLISK